TVGGDRAPVLEEVDVDREIGRLEIDRRTDAVPRAERVRDGVLDALLDEVGVIEGRLRRLGVDPERAVRLEDLLPGDARGRGVELVPGRNLEPREAQQHAYADSGPQVHGPGVFETALEAHAPDLPFELRESELAELRVQERFESWRAGDEERVSRS